MNDRAKESAQFAPRSLATRRDRVPPTAREVLLARLLLQVCDRVAAGDETQEFLELYNEVKSTAEWVVRKRGADGTPA